MSEIIESLRAFSLADQGALWVRLDDAISAVERAATCKESLQVHPAGETAGGWLPTHRHYKGTLYQLLYRATDEPSTMPVVVYKAVNGRVWVRPEHVFDGIVHVPDSTGAPVGVRRFEPIAPSPQAAAQQGDDDWFRELHRIESSICAERDALNADVYRLTAALATISARAELQARKSSGRGDLLELGRIQEIADAALAQGKPEGGS